MACTGAHLNDRVLSQGGNGQKAQHIYCVASQGASCPGSGRISTEGSQCGGRVGRGGQGDVNVNATRQQGNNGLLRRHKERHRLVLIWESRLGYRKGVSMNTFSLTCCYLKHCWKCCWWTCWQLVPAPPPPRRTGPPSCSHRQALCVRCEVCACVPVSDS